MPTFQFIARDRSGSTQRGVEQAKTAGEAVAAVRQRGWSVMDVRPAPAASMSVGEVFSRFRPSAWLPPRSIDVQLGLSQLAVMLRGGMTLLAAMGTTAEQSNRQSMRLVWESVARRVQGGSTFADALAQHRCFSMLVIQLVRVGEQTGTLEPVLRRGAEVLERRRALRSRLLTALTYPVLVLAAAVGVAAFMVLSVIPKLEVFLRALGRKLPALTQSLIDVSQWIRVNGLHIAGGALAAIVVAVLLYNWPPGRLAIDRVLLRVPVLGKLLRLAATAMFSRALGMLIRSGVTLLEALRTVENLHRNMFLRRTIMHARDNVIGGGTLSEGLRVPRTFLPMLAAMVAVGESTGTLDDVLDETAQFHEEQLESAIRRFSMIIEPAIVVLVGAIVGYVYIAFFVALFAAAGT
jgi:type IV pilus assembly protein PilC